MKSDAAKVFILIPTYNEKENISVLVEKISDLKLDFDWHILIIDDNSPDGTGKIADNLALLNKHVLTLHRQSKKGLGSAYKEGFRRALEEKADFIITMDADFSHDPEYIPNLLEAARENDLVIGSRYVRGGKLFYPPKRKILSFMANILARLVLNLKIKDATAGFKCYRGSVLSKIDFDSFISDGYLFQVESNLEIQKRGFRIKEIPIIFRDRKAGKAKMSNKEAYQGFWFLLKIAKRNLLKQKN